MMIAGSGFATFSAKIKPEFRPVTTLALTWAQASSGQWNATDRGTSSDKYEATGIRLYGNESLTNAFITAIEANRTTSGTYPNQIILSGFNSTEQIFGADIDYSGYIYATAWLDRREQGSLKGWGQSLRMQALLPLSFVGTSALPSLRSVAIGVDADADRSILKQDAYNSTIFYCDFGRDAGEFSGTLNLSASDMKNLRRFAATNRGGAFTLPTISGIQYPFGVRRGAGPFQAKLKSISDETMWGVSRWTCKINFVEQPA